MDSAGLKAPNKPDARDGTGGGALALTKAGSGVQILSGVNTYSGDTNINVGMLRMGADNIMPKNTNVYVASGATFDLVSSGDTTKSQVINALTGGGTVRGTFKTLKNNGTEGLPPMWTVQYNTDSIKVIPEPATMALLGMGAVAMLFGRRRKA